LRKSKRGNEKSRVKKSFPAREEVGYKEGPWNRKNIQNPTQPKEGEGGGRTLEVGEKKRPRIRADVKKKVTKERHKKHTQSHGGEGRAKGEELGSRVLRRGSKAAKGSFFKKSNGPVGKEGEKKWEAIWIPRGRQL